MSDAFERTEAALTKAQSRVLSFLRENRTQTPLSSRKLAVALKLSRRTVQAALAHLNDAGLLSTLHGSPNRTSVHRVLHPGASAGGKR
jgi:DNA-binding MarR family transcriptional regulator